MSTTINFTTNWSRDVFLDAFFPGRKEFKNFKNYGTYTLYYISDERTDFLQVSHLKIHTNAPLNQKKSMLAVFETKMANAGNETITRSVTRIWQRMALRLKRQERMPFEDPPAKVPTHPVEAAAHRLKEEEEDRG